MEKYKILWTDMHSNIHHEMIQELPKWVEQIKKTMDFWPIAYYPYYMRKDETGMPVEDKYSMEEIVPDWEFLRQVTKQENEAGFPMFMGYEWQGAGEDGDHNIFFKENDGEMEYPLRYQELVKVFEGKPVIGIPHHLAYQLRHRGKNWKTHNDKFSPFVEIYSSHGSSENDTTSIEMNRHIHMGPRTGETCVEEGWNQQHQFGVIASGDNHSCPGVYGFGSCAVLAKSTSKEDIWDALINKRVYGVSRNRIQLDYRIDQAVMGSTIQESKTSNLELAVVAGNKIDRIELIKDNQVIEVISELSSETLTEDKPIRFKFQLELGWGPDRRIFPDIESRKWTGKLETSGKLISIEKCWSNFGQELYQVEDNSCEFDLTTYKTTASGKWMGPSAVTTEGFIFEIEDYITSSITLTIDETTYQLPIKDILKSSKIIPLLEEAEELLKERYNFTEYYRSDPWWHNAYKIKINQGATADTYTKVIKRTIDTEGAHQIRARVWQTNGAVAWSSPIFIEKKDR